MVDLGPDRALFSISVASEVTGVNQQMLRVYEERGLVTPHRTAGGTRRYSSSELERIRGHFKVGAEIVRGVPSLQPLAAVSMEDWFVRDNPRRVQGATELQQVLEDAW